MLLKLFQPALLLIGYFLLNIKRLKMSGHYHINHYLTMLNILLLIEVLLIADKTRVGLLIIKQHSQYDSVIDEWLAMQVEQYTEQLHNYHRAVQSL